MRGQLSLNQYCQLKISCTMHLTSSFFRAIQLQIR
uniref:Uncharacterized protein n=1 Tax=Arundo donax TaxID=35708 RepID=A0A0A9C6U7_ARUDO